MSAPAIFHERSLWYESNPSVLTVATKCKVAKRPDGTANPIDVIYLPHRKSVAPGSPHETTKEEVGQVKGSGRACGLYTEVRWFDPGNSTWTDLYGNKIVDPIVFRRAVSKELVEMYAVGDPVMFDWEKMSSGWMLAVLLGTLSGPGFKGGNGTDNGGGTNMTRPFSWTDASFQIGNYAASLLRLLDKYGFAFFCQLYYGAMQPVEEREDAIRELRDAGFPGIDVFPFYDMANAHPGNLNTWRKGCGFTSNRWTYLVT